MTELEQYFPELLTIFVASFVAFTSPGPNFVAVTSRSVSSRTEGLWVATGISLGTALWALLAATGLSALLSTFPVVATVIGALGSLYLIWLGVKSLRAGISWQKFLMTEQGTANKNSIWRAFFTGLMIQLTNPKTALFWLALTAIVITPSTPWVIILLLVVGCFLLAFIWHSFLAFAFSSGPIRSVYLANKPIISIIFGGVFIFFGLRFLYTIIFVGLT